MDLNYNDILLPQAVAAQLPAALRGLDIIAMDTVDSTNAEARRQIEAAGAHELLVLADTQTAGRGRQGNSFFSPPGRGVYMSVVLCPRGPLADALRITAAAAVAVCEAVEALTGRSPAIKWVNDVFLDGKKLCGILAEGVNDPETGLARAIVVGIGVNFRTGSVPDELQSVMTALDPPAELTRNELIAAITTRLFAWADRLYESALLDDYRARSIVLGRNILFHRGEESFEGVAVEINDDANLVVQLSDGSLETLKAGEISIGSAAFVQ